MLVRSTTHKTDDQPGPNHTSTTDRSLVYFYKTNGVDRRSTNATVDRMFVSIKVSAMIIAASLKSDGDLCVFRSDRFQVRLLVIPSLCSLYIRPRQDR